MTTITSPSLVTPEDALSNSTWGVADTALWLYFFLPVIIFLPGFFIPQIGIPAAIVAAVAALHWIPQRSPWSIACSGIRRETMVSLSCVGIFAAAWCALGGAGHVFHANPGDWVPRYAVLRDLVVDTWPPHYLDGNREFILRAPLGYYLPAALLAHKIGLAWADLALLVWTWIGVALFFAANFSGAPRQRLIGVILFAGASGLDIVGFWYDTGLLPRPGSHIEWWGVPFQYWSNSSLLFWTPNHALPGWIGAAWLWRFHHHSGMVARLPVLFLPMMLWSPLTALGLFPLALVLLYDQWHSNHLGPTKVFISLALTIPVAGLIATYLLMNVGAIESSFSPAQPNQAVIAISADFTAYLLFFTLEAGLFGAIALQRNRSPIIIASIAILAILPWFRFGPYNDLVMRGSIPALTVLWLTLIAELTAPMAQRTLSRSLRQILIVLCLIGLATPFQEVYRALTKPRWAPDTTLPAPAALGGLAPHYFAPKNDSILQSLLRH
jgi:hypothetical protein